MLQVCLDFILKRITTRLTLDTFFYVCAQIKQDCANYASVRSDSVQTQSFILQEWAGVEISLQQDG